MLAPLPKPIKILLIDDHQIVLDSLANLLGAVEGLEVVGKTTNGNQALDLLVYTPVDILITDLNMPECGGIELCTQLRQRFPQVKILMLTMADDLQSIQAAIRAGVMGYVLKRAGLDELTNAIEAVMGGTKYFSDEVINELAGAVGENPVSLQSAKSISLTDRELEIVKLIAQEYSTPQIAEKLFISIATVETHRQRMSHKIGVKGAVGLVLYAMKEGLLD